MHPSIRPYLEYFSLPKGYGPSGLRWAANGEALETDDGTHRFTRQIADFIDGFAAVRSVPHFGHLLECLDLLGMLPPSACLAPEHFKLLAATFRQLGGPARNAGALFGHLCAAIPPAVHVPRGGGKSLAHWLTHSPSLGFLHPTGPGNPEVPSLAAHAFHDRVASRLRTMTDFEVRHWLRHGIGPQDLPAEQLAEQLEHKPPTMGEFLDDALKDRSRLSGAVPLVRHFVSALSLPPRYRTPPKLPIGGYADVTNHGDPARLLPSQFALDPDEFVRRFAENELLFFRREDPHERQREHLAIVADQGVLTWGPVRLALSAAVLAFGRLAARRKLTFTVRCGSAPTEQFHPPEGDSKRFGDVLETSDLSTNPGHALAEEVLNPAAGERDIVLLTHPRVLRDGEIHRLSRSLAKGSRLFALTATEAGEVELVHLREGGIVPVSRFRVDFAPPVPAEPKPPPEVAPYIPWTGDVEPIPFPFRFGLTTNRAEDVAFDTGGERLAATCRGYVHVWTLANGEVEVLPRGYREGQTLTDVQAVLGMAHGFVVCGKLGPALVTVHYDWSRRTASMHTLTTEGSNMQCVWYAFPQLHSVVVKVGPSYRAVDLSTGGPHPDPLPNREVSTRAQTAIAEARQLYYPPPAVPVMKTDDTHVPCLTTDVYHDVPSGRIGVTRPRRPRVAFTPTQDGRPRLQGVGPLVAQLAGDTLALSTTGSRGVWTIHDLRNDGNTWAEYPNSPAEQVAKLSPDGRFFVRQTASGVLVVTEPAAGRTLLTTSPGRCHSNLDVRLGPRWLSLRVGSWCCTLDWTEAPLEIRPVWKDAVPPNKSNRALRLLDRAGWRFGRIYDMGDCQIGVDHFGQIVFVNYDGRVVCMFLYRRGKLAAWAPAGIRYGPPELTGGPETPGALEKLGQILRNATG